MIFDRHAPAAQGGLAMGDASTGLGNAIGDAGRLMGGAQLRALAEVVRQRGPVGGEALQLLVDVVLG
jgi:hypothetical protein